MQVGCYLNKFKVRAKIKITHVWKTLVRAREIVLFQVRNFRLLKVKFGNTTAAQLNLSDSGLLIF